MDGLGLLLSLSATSVSCPLQMGWQLATLSVTPSRPARGSCDPNKCEYAKHPKDPKDKEAARHKYCRRHLVYGVHSVHGVHGERKHRRRHHHHVGSKCSKTALTASTSCLSKSSTSTGTTSSAASTSGSNKAYVVQLADEPLPRPSLLLVHLSSLSAEESGGMLSGPRCVCRQGASASRWLRVKGRVGVALPPLPTPRSPDKNKHVPLLSRSPPSDRVRVGFPSATPIERVVSHRLCSHVSGGARLGPARTLDSAVLTLALHTFLLQTVAGRLGLPALSADARLEGVDAVAAGVVAAGPLAGAALSLVLEAVLPLKLPRGFGFGLGLPAKAAT